MILNEQFISDMFDNQTSQQHMSIPQQEVSLNFTVSSRSTKHHKKEIKEDPIQYQNYFPEQTIDIANIQLVNVKQMIIQSSQYILDTQHKFETCFFNINALILQIQTNSDDKICEDDLLIIKRQMLKKDYEVNKQCLICQDYKQQIQKLQKTIQNQQIKLDDRSQTIKKLSEYINSIQIDIIKQNLLRDVEINILNSDIKDLNNEINILKNQKYTLQRTFLFNKTRNSQLNPLQKSKSLSAAKNSTNSSQLNIIRNNQTLIFIDPVQSDVDQWIRFFQQQKNRYLSLLKKQQGERCKDLIKNIPKQQQKVQQNDNGKFSILHNCLQNILINLLKIRQSTTNFNMIQSNKFILRQKINNELSQDYKKQEISKLLIKIKDLKLKITKLQKINRSLIKQKQNVQQINNNLKQQRILFNNQKYSIYNQFQVKMQEYHLFQEKYLEFKEKIIEMTIHLESTERLIKQITSQLEGKQAQIQKYKTQEKYYHQLEKKIKKIEGQVVENNKGYQVHINSLTLKLKKEWLQRKKVHNQLEETKGNIRLYCRIMDNKGPNQQIYQFQDLIVEIQNQKLFNKLFYGQNNSQQKVYEDIKRLVNGAFDGFHMTLLSYSQSNLNKSYTMHGTSDNPGIIPRVFKQIFKYIEGQKQFMQVQVSLNVLQYQNDKFIGLLANQKILNYQIKQNQEGNVYLANYPQFTVQNHQELLQLYQDALSSKKIREKYKQNNKAHFIMTINLEIFNKKTQEMYRSKINLIQLAQIQKMGDLSMSKQPSFINKSISSLFNVLNGLNIKQKVNFRQNKFTHYLKDSLSPNNKTILLFTFNSSQLLKQQTKTMISFASKFNLHDKNCRQNDREQSVKQKRSVSRKNI